MKNTKISYDKPIISVRDLAVNFYTGDGRVEAVGGISYDLYEGETLGIVGESGSGKSVSAMSILNLVDDPGRIEKGEILYDGRNLLELSESDMRNIRGNHISFVMQDPMSSLNPVDTIEYQIARVIRKHRNISKAAARRRAVELIGEMGIPEPEERADEYPHQLSGGMRQRVLLAMAISCEPDVLILDEPTTALDVTIEAQIFDLIADLQEDRNMSVILITHDLGVVAGTCDRVAVFYAGQIVEKASINLLFEDPRHPYTRGLMRSIPRLSESNSRLTPIDGTVPNPANLPSGCSFHPRCPHATECCQSVNPKLRGVTSTTEVACIHAEGYGPISDDFDQTSQKSDSDKAETVIDGGVDE
jgi:oligopeptide/dipeptide ABC transporter ATP-binding protein